MSYFVDCFNALVSLSTTRLNSQIALACANNGIGWTDVDFTPQKGHFITEEVEPEDVHLSPEIFLPCLSIYFKSGENQQYTLGNSFSGPVYFCMDMHIGTELNDQVYQALLQMCIAEGMYRTFDSQDPVIPQTWKTYGVAYSRGLQFEAGKSTLFDAQQFQDYEGANIWLKKLQFTAKFNLIRI